MAMGKVWLVGGGPGDVGLFTIKGQKVLENADVVIYDRLVGHGILAMMPVNAKCIDVGKKAGEHKMSQEKINKLLLEQALAGKNVVRLKGGDPFLFGRGGEELELLKQHNVPFEIVPGITSAISVPAYNGIPVTHREYCSSLHIITGHKKKGASYDIDFEALVRTKGTLVFLMGIAALEDICNELLQKGMSPNTPAAVLEKGTTAGQRKIIGTIENLEKKVKEQGVETPAIIMVGDVCGLEEEFAWYEELPLFGYKVAITRPRELVSKMAESLRIKGAEVLELPTIVTKSFEIDSNEMLSQAFNNISQYQWIGFTSPTGVRVFFDAMIQIGKDIRSLYGIKIAVIGQGTKKAVEEKGILVDFIPQTYNGEMLGSELAQICDKGDKILLPRAKEGNLKLVESLTGAGIKVDDIPIYQTKYETFQILHSEEEWNKAQIDCVVFTSASTVKGFVHSFKEFDYSKITAACIGSQTQAEAKKYGMKTYVSKKATIESLIDLVIELKKSNTKEACCV